MTRATLSRQDQQLRYAILPALVAGAAGFALTWLLLIPPNPAPPQPAATLRVRLEKGSRGDLAMDEAVARLLSQESLAKTLTAAGVLDGATKPSAAQQMAEQMREWVRVDIRLPDEAGVQEVLIRWAGDPREPLAGRLVKALARQLAARLAAVDPVRPQREYEAARSELSAAATAVADLRAQFETALEARPVRPAGTPPRQQPNVDQAARSLPALAEADDTQLARQRLLEFEQRRQLLADRLMPEHPEMRALEEKIDELKRAVARKPQPARQRRPPLEVPAEDRTRQEPDEGAIVQTRQLWQATLEAESRYTAALAHERGCWHALAVARGPFVAEIESTHESARGVERAAGWRQWLLSVLATIVCGGLALAAWPRRRQTLASAEEVRAVTRLPVVVIESASLN
jgi:hypothetical protein